MAFYLVSSLETYDSGLEKGTGFMCLKYDFSGVPAVVQRVEHPTAGAPVVAQRKTDLTSVHEDAGSTPGLAQCVGDLVLP